MAEQKQIKYIDPLAEYYDDTKLPNLNRFLVTFPKECEINEWWVESFKKPYYDISNEKTKNGPIKVRIRPYFSKNGKIWKEGMTDEEIWRELRRLNEVMKGPIVFQTLDRTGVAISQTLYFEPRFIGLDFDEYHYSNNHIASFVLIIEFNGMHEGLDKEMCD